MYSASNKNEKRTYQHNLPLRQEKCKDLFLEGKGAKTDVRDTCVISFLSHIQLGTWPTTQACALTGNGNCDLSVHRLAINLLSYTSQGHQEKSKITLVKKR